MRLAYVAGPYRGPSESAVVQNIRNAEAVAIALWKMGYAVICPHKNTALFGGLAPDHVWLAGDLVMMERCDLVVLVPGWQHSSGTQAEIKRANELRIPVFQWPHQCDELQHLYLLNAAAPPATITPIPTTRIINAVEDLYLSHEHRPSCQAVKDAILQALRHA